MNSPCIEICVLEDPQILGHLQDALRRGVEVRAIVDRAGAAGARVVVQVSGDNVSARTRPSDDEPVVATLGRGTVATKLEESGDWTRIEMLDGRRVWVRADAVNLVEASGQ